MLLALLGVGVGATATAPITTTEHTWAMRHALSFLAPVDAARLVVALLEGGGRDGDDGADSRARVHWLRFGDAPFAPIDNDMLLEVAASHACWRALCMLLEDVRAASPTWVTLLDDDIADVEGLYDSYEWIRRATIAHRGTHFRFGHDAAKAAAARGDLQAVQWFWPRLAKTSGQVEPTRRASDDSNEHRTRAEIVLEAAAGARHLRIIEWVIQTSPLVHCVMPYDEELEAVCWIMRQIYYSHGCDYFCATKKYGFCQAKSQDTVSDDGMTWAGTTEMPLADPFARDGDLDTLKKILARPNYPQLVGSKAFVLAAEGGHLDVVKWLVSVLPKYSLSECLLAASKGGHIPILEWLHRERNISISFDVPVEAAKHGHVHVLRWLGPIIGISYSYARAMASACQYGHVDTIAFLHHQFRTPYGWYLSDSLTKCPSIETIDYVLDRIKPLPERDAFLQRAVQAGHAHVVKHLVINRGMWSRQAVCAAVACRDPSSALGMTQFLYAQAQERARHLQTTLEDQIDLTRVTVAIVKHRAVAEWLLQSVPGVRVSNQSLASMDVERGTKQVFRAVLTACIKYRPEECRNIPWLPVWAVHTNSFEALELLAQYSHPQVRDVGTLQAVTTHTRDARFMLKLLPLPEDEPNLHQDVVEWAAKYGMVSVLDRIFDREDEPRVQQQLLKHVAHLVGVSGNVEMANWLVRRCVTLTISPTTVFKSVCVDAVCHSHTHVLQWLREHLPQLIPARPHAIEKLVTAAGKARQVRSLQWLLVNMESEIQPKWITHVLVEAVRQNHAEIVEFITRAFERDALPVGGKDLQRIRLCLQRIRRSHERGVTAAQSIVAETITSERRAKRCRRH